MSQPKFDDSYYQALINQQLAGVFFDLQADKLGGSEYRQFINELVALLGRGGKRLRPRLVLAAYQAYGGRQVGRIVPLAVAMELVHAFLLIHDDIVDDDFARWGGPNIAGSYLAKLQAAAQTPAQARLAATSMALLAGDRCLLLAQQQLLKSRLSQNLKLAAQDLFNDVITEVISGEVDELAPAASPGRVALLDMYGRKTASYSFSMPLVLGGLAAGAPAGEIKKLNDAGRAAGVAFQLSDDLGDLAQDKKAGKTTLPMLLAKSQPGADPHQATEKLIQYYVRQSLKALEGTAMSQTGKNYLRQLLNQL